MKKIIYIVLVMALTLVTSLAKAGKYKTTGNYKKLLVEEKILDFSETKTLYISNERGSVTLTNWEKPQVSITVELVADMHSQRKLQKLIDRTEVKISNDGWHFVSKIQGGINLRNETFSFNYIIHAPKNLHIDLQTRFGDVWLESVNVASVIDCEFVSLQLMSTEGSDVQPFDLNLKFANNVHIDYVSNLDLNAQFSTVYIDKVDKIQTNTRFSKIYIKGETAKAAVDSQHDNMQWDILGDIYSKNMEFTILSVEKLLKKMDLRKVSFGKIKVEDVAEDFESIKINAGFTPITIELNSAEYKFDIESEFGKIILPEGVDILINKKEDNLQQFKGKKAKTEKTGYIKILNQHAKTIIK